VNTTQSYHGGAQGYTDHTQPPISDAFLQILEKLGNFLKVESMIVFIRGGPSSSIFHIFAPFTQ
jgi:hypothetical protein